MPYVTHYDNGRYGDSQRDQRSNHIERYSQPPVQGFSDRQAFIQAPVPAKVEISSRNQPMRSQPKQYHRNHEKGGEYGYPEQDSDYGEYAYREEVSDYRYEQDRNPRQPYYPPLQESQTSPVRRLSRNPINDSENELKNGAKSYKNDFVNPEFMIVQPQKKFMYGCIPINKRSRITCLSVLFGILVILGVLIGLFFPRFPEMKVNEINIAPARSNGELPYSISKIDKRKSIIDFSFSLNMIMSVTVTNRNFYRLKMDDISIAAFMVSNATMINSAIPAPFEGILSTTGSNRVPVTQSNFRNKIGSGSHGAITFPPDQPVTFTIPFNVKYSTNPSVTALYDPVINELIQLCISPSTDNRTTTIEYSAMNTIKAVSWFGYKPTLSDKLKINCPLQGAILDKFIDGIQG